jgi:hypothetical protein
MKDNDNETDDEIKEMFDEFRGEVVSALVRRHNGTVEAKYYASYFGIQCYFQTFLGFKCGDAPVRDVEVPAATWHEMARQTIEFVDSVEDLGEIISGANYFIKQIRDRKKELESKAVVGDA